MSASTAIPLLLGLVALGLGVAHVTVRVLDRLYPGNEVFEVLRSLFDLDFETNVPSWFSAALWIGAAILAVRLGWRIRPERLHWFAIAAVAACLSLDEAASLHERAELAMVPEFEAVAPESLSFIYPWTIAGGLFAAVVGLLLLRFVLSLPRHAAVAIILAGVLFVVGALGFETIGAAVGGRVIPRTFEGIWLVLTLFEELLEMSGVILLIHALLWVGEQAESRA